MMAIFYGISAVLTVAFLRELTHSTVTSAVKALLWLGFFMSVFGVAANLDNPVGHIFYWIGLGLAGSWLRFRKSKSANKKSDSKLTAIRVSDNGTQDHVLVAKTWIGVKNEFSFIVVEASTSPHNTPDEWSGIVWSGDTGDPLEGRPNCRRLSCKKGGHYRISAALGGVSDALDLWIVWAEGEVLIHGIRPSDAAPFDAGTRDNSDALGAVTYLSFTSSLIGETTVSNMGASAKVVIGARLLPDGIHKIVGGGWTLEREAWSSNFIDGKQADSSNATWTRDTSQARYLRLTAGADEKIYDTDAPDIRWGRNSYETYNNFREWVEWNGQRCSDMVLWSWRARWTLDADLEKQITLNELRTGSISLPKLPFYPGK